MLKVHVSTCTMEPGQHQDLIKALAEAFEAIETDEREKLLSRIAVLDADDCRIISHELLKKMVPELFMTPSLPPIITGMHAEFMIVDELHQQIIQAEDLKVGEIYTAIEKPMTNRKARRAAASKRRRKLSKS